MLSNINGVDLWMNLKVSENHYFGWGINLPSTIFFILNLIHHSIPIVKTSCTTSSDDRSYHDHERVSFWLSLNLSVPNKWTLICYSFEVKLVEETNLIFFMIRFEGAMWVIEIWIIHRTQKWKTTLFTFLEFCVRVSMLFDSRPTVLSELSLDFLAKLRHLNHNSSTRDLLSRLIY